MATEKTNRESTKVRPGHKAADVAATEKAAPKGRGDGTDNAMTNEKAEHTVKW